MFACTSLDLIAVYFQNAVRRAEEAEKRREQERLAAELVDSSLRRQGGHSALREFEQSEAARLSKGSVRVHIRVDAVRSPDPLDGVERCP